MKAVIPVTFALLSLNMAGLVLAQDTAQTADNASFVDSSEPANSPAAYLGAACRNPSFEQDIQALESQLGGSVVEYLRAFCAEAAAKAPPLITSEADTSAAEPSPEGGIQ
jgi:hypothetical protein